MVHGFKATGGMGNCLAAAFSAHLTGLPLSWHPTGPLRMDDIFVNPEVIIKGAPGTGRMTWMYPGIRPKELGTVGHYPNHEGLIPSEYKWPSWYFIPQDKTIPDNECSLIVRKDRSFDIPDNCVGIHVRSRHPSHPIDLNLASKRINELSEQMPIFLSSDAPIPDIRKEVIVSPAPKMTKDNDRGREMIEAGIMDWTTLGKCKAIYRSTSGSTFCDYWVFREHKQMYRLFPVEIKA